MLAAILVALILFAVLQVLLLAGMPNGTAAELSAIGALMIASVAATLAGIGGAILAARIGRRDGAAPFAWLAAVANLAVFALAVVLSDSLGKSGDGSVVAQSIALVIAAGFAGMFLMVGARQYAEQHRLLRNAVPVRATIVATEVRGSVSADTDPSLQRNTSTTTWEPVVRFRYTAGGRTHESDRLRATSIVQTYASAESARAAIASFTPGQQVDAFMAPAEPDKAFLTREAGLGPVVFLALGIAIPGLVWAVAILAL